MQCGTSKLIWPIFVYFRLHYTLCKGSAPRAPSGDGEAAINPVPCSKQPSALVFKTKKSTPITQMGRKHRDKPSLPPFSTVRFLHQGHYKFVYMNHCFFIKKKQIKSCLVFYLFDLFFKPTLCTNFGRRSRGVSLELLEYSREKQQSCNPVLSFPFRPCANALWHFPDCSTEPVLYPRLTPYKCSNDSWRR